MTLTHTCHDYNVMLVLCCKVDWPRFGVYQRGARMVTARGAPPPPPRALTPVAAGGGGDAQGWERGTWVLLAGACRKPDHAGTDRVGRLREAPCADGSVEVRSLGLHSLSGCPT